MTPTQKRAYGLLGLGPVWRQRMGLKKPSQIHPASGNPSSPSPDSAASEIRASVVADSLSSDAEAQAAWQSLEAAVSGCQACRLCESRTQVVFGEGNRRARLVLVGEAPGQQEDRQGVPFVGRAGALLDEMLSSLGLHRAHDVFIVNVLKCRPPKNRDPDPAEVLSCAPFLAQQLSLVAPDLIVALGRFAAQELLKSNDGVARLRGVVHQYAPLGQQPTPLVVTFHPAYLLRNALDKSKAWADLCLVRSVLKGKAKDARLPLLSHQ